MTVSLDNNTIIREIEFELAQGLISRDDLGQGVRAARDFHARLRADWLAQKPSTEHLADIVSRQFQFNDMLLTLMQELSASNRAMQQRLAGLSPIAQQPAAIPAPGSNPPLPEQLEARAELASLIVEAEKPIELDMQQQSRIPGLRQLRMMLHGLSLFYAHKLQKRQSRINRLLSQAIEELRP